LRFSFAQAASHFLRSTGRGVSPFPASPFTIFLVRLYRGIYAHLITGAQAEQMLSTVRRSINAVLQECYGHQVACLRCLDLV
jgi:hypothetical protein